MEQALAAQEAHVAAGGSGSGPAAPLARWAALQQIEQWRADYEAGDSFALLHAVAECAKRELVMPKWVITGFLGRYREVIHYKVKSLDEAFGSYLPKNAKLAARRQKREKAILAYYEVKRRCENGAAIDENLWKSVGVDMNISGSKVRDYYYHWKNRFSENLPK